MSHLRLMDEQLSAMPFASPATVVNHLSQAVTRVTRLAPELTDSRCVRLLGELALFMTVLDEIQHQVEHLAAYYGKKPVKERRISLA